MKNSYSNVISCLTEKTSERFQDLKTHPIFKSIVILDGSLWPRDDLNLSVYGEKEIDAFSKHFSPLLSNNGCDVDKIMAEWDLVKLEVNTLISGRCVIKYFDVWQRLLQQPGIPTKMDCTIVAYHAHNKCQTGKNAYQLV